MKKTTKKAIKTPKKSLKKPLTRKKTKKTPLTIKKIVVEIEKPLTINIAIKFLVKNNLFIKNRYLNRRELCIGMNDNNIIKRNI